MKFPEKQVFKGLWISFNGAEKHWTVLKRAAS
jgi:hypothetical protein